MGFTKKERKLEAISLEGFGLLSEEVEGYFDFYDAIWISEKSKRKKIVVINSRKKADKANG